jgi:hypothetical protein
VRTERKRAAAGKLLEAPEVSFAKTTRGVPRRFLSSPTHEPPYLYIHAHRSHLLIHEKSISHTARHPFQTALSLRRERRGDGRLLLELIIVGVRRGADRRLGTRLPQELAPDLTRRPEPPQARTGPRPPSALYLLSLPPPLGVVGRCRSIRWALRRGGILECGNGSIRFIYSWGSLRKFFWGGSRLLTGGVRGGSFFVGVDLSARWFS